MKRSNPKQKIIGLTLILISILIIKINQNQDITPVLLIFPLGIYALFTKTNISSTKNIHKAQINKTALSKNTKNTNRKKVS